jgi:PAS domain S-box-containing protein
MTQPLRILILDNNPEDVTAVINELKDCGRECSPTVAVTESEFTAALRDQPPDLVLAERMVGSYDGFSALAATRKLLPRTPFIFVTHVTGEESAIDALHHGAADWVSKRKLDRLDAAVGRALSQLPPKGMAAGERRDDSYYRSAFEHCPDGIVIVDPETARPVEFNAAAHQFLGYSREEFSRLSLFEINAVESPLRIREMIEQVRKSQRGDFETRHRAKDGKIRDVQVTTQPMHSGGREVFLCVWRDVTARKQAEQRISELNLVLRASSAINALMVRERDPRRLLNEACKILVETRGYALAWVALTDSGPGDLKVVATAGEVSPRADGGPADLAPIRRAITSRLPEICPDFAGVPQPEPWHAEARARGIASMAAVPIVQGPHTLGAVAVYSRRAGAFHPGEVSLLKELATDLAFALQSIEDGKERSHAEALLRESERRYRLLFNSGYDAVFVHQSLPGGKASGKFIEVNDIACQRLGYTRQELLQMTPVDISAPETLPDMPSIRALLAMEKSAVSEGVHLTKDGRRIPVEISTHVFQLNGKTTRLSTVRDITDRKRAESRLHLLSEALESAANAIVITDREGCIIWVNAAFTQLTGYPVEDVLGQKPNVLKSGAHPREFYRNLWETVLSGRVWSAEMINRRKDGSVYTEENTITPVRNEAGDITHFIAVKQDVTARKRAEAELRESEMRFHSVWANSTDGMRLTDGNGIVLDVNEAFCRLVKLPREKLVGKVFSVAYLGHGPKDGIDVYQQRFATGKIVPLITARTKLWDASDIDLEVSSSFIEMGKAGKMLFSIFRDVSERSRIQQRMEAFANLGRGLSAARSAIGAATFITEIADRLLGWDACTLDLYTPEDDRLHHLLAYDTIDGKRTETDAAYIDMAPTSLARRVIQEGGQLILRAASGKPAEGVVPFGDTSRASASILMVPIRNGSEVAGIMSIHSYKPGAYDARSLETLQALADHCGAALVRIRVQEAWRLAEQRLRHLITQSPAIIYSLKTDGQKVEHAWISDNVKHLLGYDAAEVGAAHGLFDRIHAQDRQAIAQGLAELLERKHVARDFRVRHKSGNYRWVRDEQRLVCDARGAPVEIVGSWTDITERKALEEELRQAQKMEAVGRLAGGVAHDFNNLLAVIRGNADLLLMDRTGFSHDTVEGLRHVVEASERAASLTRQLLAFSRKQVLQPQALLPNQVIANLTKMLKRVIGENIDLRCEYAEPLPHVHADLGMMEQVLLNLVVNARDAMPQGGKLVVRTESRHLDEDYARAHPEGRAGDFVCVTVRDNGTGIAPEVLPRIFEPFFTTKEVGKGTGLGLATVYGIVQQHQGWVEVASQVGRGTSFSVFLPAMSAAPQPAASASPEQPPPGGSETILLVEDDQAVRATTRKLLESKGYKVLEATTARAALKLWRERALEISMLLSDLIMPEQMTGRELAECLWQEKPHLKVVFISGYSADVVGKNTDFIRKTGSHFLQKPFSSRALLEVIRRCLDEPGPSGRHEEGRGS